MNEDHESPLAPLAELESEVSSEFLSAVRKKIYRRVAANQLASFSWNVPKLILLEFIPFLADLFSAKRQRGG